MITLKSRIKIKREYAGTSKFLFWKTLQPDDVLEISTPLKSIYGKPDVTVTKTCGDTFKSTMTLIYNYLDKLEYEEL